MFSGGQVAFVTGGTRGIGAAITRALAKEDICVAAGYSRGSDSAAKVKAELEQQGAKISIHQGRVD
ncbi:MAG: SDR family NAD(P)-dependent oxidoreductase, partial [Vulcanimicrobiaceae bacterium]